MEGLYYGTRISIRLLLKPHGTRKAKGWTIVNGSAPRWTDGDFPTVKIFDNLFWYVTEGNEAFLISLDNEIGNQYFVMGKVLERSDRKERVVHFTANPILSIRGLEETPRSGTNNSLAHVEQIIDENRARSARARQHDE